MIHICSSCNYLYSFLESIEFGTIQEPEQNGCWQTETTQCHLCKCSSHLTHAPTDPTTDQTQAKVQKPLWKASSFRLWLHSDELWLLDLLWWERTASPLGRGAAVSTLHLTVPAAQKQLKSKPPRKKRLCRHRECVVLVTTGSCSLLVSPKQHSITHSMELPSKQSPSSLFMDPKVL